MRFFHRKPMISLTWGSAGNDGPDGERDQNAELPGRYVGSVGPDGLPGRDAWSWSVFEIVDPAGDWVDVTGGYEPTEIAAKSAVERFAREVAS